MRRRKLQKIKLPELHNAPRGLFSVCLGIVSCYLPLVCAYALCVQSDLAARDILVEMLHSAAISAFLSLGGALVLDLAIREQKK